MPTDSDLLRRYVDPHDETAFTELVRRHVGVVYNAALRRVNGHAHLAEEATQLVFTQLACKARRLSRHPALLGWLHTSTRFAASVLIRREQRLTARHELAATMPPDDSTNSPPWDTLRPLIDAALDRLSAEDRHAVLLRFFATRSFAEIGTELGVSENAARKRVDRALENLRRQFARQGVTTTASALAAALTAAPAVAAPPQLIATIATTATANASVGALITLPLAFAAVNTAKIASLVAAVVGAATLGTAVLTWQHQEARRAQLDVLHAEASALHARTMAFNHTLAMNRTLPSPAPTAGNASSEEMRRRYEDQLLLATSPAYAAIREQRARLNFLRDYGAFVTSRGYSSAQIEALRQAMIRYQNTRAIRLAESALGSDGGKKLRATVEPDQLALFTELGATFSEPELKEIRRCFDAQNSVYDAHIVSLDMNYAGVPIDRVQELAVAMIASDADKASKAQSADQRRELERIDPSSGLSQADRQLLDDATAFLSPEQLSVYERFLRLNNARYTALTKAQRMYREAHPGS